MGNELAIYNRNNLSLEEMKQVGQIFVQSGLFPNDKDIAKAITKIIAGQEIGLPAFQAMSSIYFINGVRAMNYAVIGAKIQESGRYRYNVLELDNKHCIIEWEEKRDDDWVKVGRSKFDEDDAKAAGLLGKDNWKKWGEAMFFARALTKGQRMYAPAIFNGPVYDPQELKEMEVENLSDDMAGLSNDEFIAVVKAEVDDSLTKDIINNVLREAKFTWKVSSKREMFNYLVERFSNKPLEGEFEVNP